MTGTPVPRTIHARTACAAAADPAAGWTAGRAAARRGEVALRAAVMPALRSRWAAVAARRRRRAAPCLGSALSCSLSSAGEPGSAPGRRTAPVPYRKPILQPIRSRSARTRPASSANLFTSGHAQALKHFLVDEGAGKNGRLRRLTLSFSALYRPGSDEKRWMDRVRAQGKGLGFQRRCQEEAWPFVHEAFAPFTGCTESDGASCWVQGMHSARTRAR
jgi:hypothetical protein